MHELIKCRFFCSWNEAIVHHEAQLLSLFPAESVPRSSYNCHKDHLTFWVHLRWNHDSGRAAAILIPTAVMRLVCGYRHPSHRWHGCWILLLLLLLLSYWSFPSSRQQLSNDDCLEDKMEDNENCSVLCCLPHLYTCWNCTACIHTCCCRFRTSVRVLRRCLFILCFLCAPCEPLSNPSSPLSLPHFSLSTLSFSTFHFHFLTRVIYFLVFPSIPILPE